MDRDELTVVVNNDDLKQTACAISADVKIAVTLTHDADGIADCVFDIFIVNTMLAGIVRDLH